ncbi:MAG: hypothetical protein RI958_3133 [Actinomycetota bacterium]
MAHQDTSHQSSQPASPPSSVNVSDVVDLVKEYARQETLGPLRGAGRWIAFGLAGSLLIGSGVLLVVLGILRLVQNEFGDTFDGRWMGLLPYLFALLASLAVIAIAVSRISKSSLHRD